MACLGKLGLGKVAFAQVSVLTPIPALSPSLPAMSTVFSVRKRTLFQPLKKPKLTGEQKKAQKARSGELEARLDSFADTINREVKAMAQEFNK